MAPHPHNPLMIVLHCNSWHIAPWCTTAKAHGTTPWVLGLLYPASDSSLHKSDLGCPGCMASIRTE